VFIFLVFFADWYLFLSYYLHTSAIVGAAIMAILVAATVSSLNECTIVLDRKCSYGITAVI
jgi:hypothetical protein